MIINTIKIIRHLLKSFEHTLKSLKNNNNHYKKRLNSLENKHGQIYLNNQETIKLILTNFKDNSKTNKIIIQAIKILRKPLKSL